MAGNKSGVDEVVCAVSSVGSPKAESNAIVGRTMALCAGLCLLGIVLKVELDERMSASRIGSDFRHQPSAATRFQSPQPKPSGSTSIPATNRSPR